MLGDIITYFKDLKKCPHHKQCRYADNDPASVCMNGGGPYCSVDREWDTRLEAHLQ